MKIFFGFFFFFEFFIFTQGVNTTHKFIIMERLQETIVDLMRRRYPGEKEEKPLEEAQQDRIIEICEQLDAAGLVQNDGNPL